MKEKINVGIGMPAALYLQEFGQVILEVFGDVPYHVGSSLFGKTWRDVDVRLIVTDEDYMAMNLGEPNDPHANAKWCGLAMAFSELGRKMTGLPIDFQIQQMSYANEKFPREDGCLRSALFVRNK